MDTGTTLGELKAAREELLQHHKELEKCADDLRIANGNLDIGKAEKGRRADEVHGDLEEMMFTVSHKVRKSVANILGISNLLCRGEDLSAGDWREMLQIIIQSAESLNTSTEELSKFIHLKKNTCLDNSD